MANAGRVAIVPKGEYNSATAYKRLDLVRYNNAVYVARKANTGVSPTKTDTWMLCIQNVTQEQYDDLISGAVQVESAKEADNALKLENLTAKQVGESGARNLIPYPYIGSTNSNIVNFKDNGDGTITATVNGTITTTETFYLAKNYTIRAGNYVLSGCPSDGSWTSHHMRIVKTDGTNLGADVGNGKTYNFSEDTTVNILISISTGVTLTELTFKPMLEHGLISHDYVPSNDFYRTIPIDLDGTIIDCFSLIPGHYNFKAVSTDMNFPVTDSTTLEATLIITGSYNVANEKGYRKYYYHDNKGRRYYANEWWGNTPVWKGNADGGNADTVDGKHASDFLLTTGGTATGALGTNTRFARYVTHYEKGTVPSSHVWNDGVAVYDKNGAVLGGVQNAVYTNGSSVTRLIAEQLVDGVSVGSIISAEVTADGKIFGTAPTPDNATDNSIKIATTAWVNKFMLSIIGNSSAVIQSTSAPSDTSAVWVDTANKVTKIYKDGAWTALA